MATQEAAYILNIRGSSETIQSLLQVQKLIAANAQELKELKIEAGKAEKEFNKLMKSSKSMREEHERVKNELQKVDERMKKLLATNKQAGKEYAQLKQKKKELREEDQRLTKAIDKNTQAVDRQKSKYDIASKSIATLTAKQIESKHQHNELAKAARNQAKQFEFLNSGIEKDRTSLSGMERNLRAMRAEFVKLNETTRNSPFGRALLADIHKTDSAVKKLRASMGQFQQSVGNYPGISRGLVSFTKQMLGAFGIGSALYVGVGIIRNATKTVVDFNKAQVELQSLSGQSAEQLRGLTDQAKKLGRETLFTATEVTKLQVELSKLGFTNTEISQVTESVINFAVALDAEVAPAATVAASTMRAFGLDASEMERIVSVLGVAANKTALSFEDFEGNIATFAPVARQFGFSIEDAITLFGKLRDAGFDASTAATALRNIFLKMADPNGDLAKRLGAPVKNLDELAVALKKLKSEGLDLGEAFELTGERSVAAFGQIVAESGSLIELRDSLTDVNEEFREMVEKRLKSVDAQLKLTKAAWDGLVLSIDEGDGVISEAVAGLLSGFRELLGVITDANEGMVSWGAIGKDVLKGLALGSPIGSLYDSFFGFDSSVKEQQENFAATERVIKTSVERVIKILKEGSEEEKKLVEERIKQLEAKAKAGDVFAKAFIKQYQLLSEGTVKVIDDIVPDPPDDPISKFAKGTIGFLEERISKLNEILQNTTSETVIQQTISQIIQLEKAVEKIEEKITKARREAEGIPGIAVGLETPTTDQLLQSVGEATVGLGIASLERANDRELEMIALHERLKQDIKNKNREEELSLQSKFDEIRLRAQQQYNDSVTTLYTDLGNIMSGIFSGQLKTQDDVFKELLLLTLKFAESQARIALETANFISVAQAGLNPALLAKAAAEFAIRQGLVSALFAVLRGVVEGFEEGGVVKGGVEFRKPGSKDDTLIHVKKGEMILTEHNQSKARQAFGEDVFGVMGVKGFNAPAFNNHITNVNNNNSVAKLDRQSIKEMKDEMREGVAAAILETETSMRNYEREYKHVKR